MAFVILLNLLDTPLHVSGDVSMCSFGVFLSIQLDNFTCSCHLPKSRGPRITFPMMSSDSPYSITLSHEGEKLETLHGATVSAESSPCCILHGLRGASPTIH